MTRPFGFEGKRGASGRGRDRAARERGRHPHRHPERPAAIDLRPQVSVLDAFRPADQVLLSGVQGITDLITTPGLINLRLRRREVGDVGRGLGADGDRSVPRSRTARSPLRNWLFPARCSRRASTAPTASCCRCRVDRTWECSRSTRRPAGAEGGARRGQHHLGAVIDDTLGDEVRVTVIVAGVRRDQLGRTGPAAAPPRGDAGPAPAPCKRHRRRPGAPHPGAGLAALAGQMAAMSGPWTAQASVPACGTARSRGHWDDEKAPAAAAGRIRPKPGWEPGQRRCVAALQAAEPPTARQHRRGREPGGWPEPARGRHGRVRAGSG